MAKLHELLAVEGQLKTQAQTTRNELRNTFEKKRHLFEEKVVTFQSTEEGGGITKEQQSDLQSKVQTELEWIAGIWSKAIDASYLVAQANTTAFANVILDDGTLLLEKVPATGLLELEKRVSEIEELIKGIPTLDPAKGFTLDKDRGAHIYKARDVEKTRTRKTQRPLVLYPATPEHPAQTQIISEDVPIGKIVEQEWSGLITPAIKGDMIARAETVRRAVKQARQRANDVELTPNMQLIGMVLFNHIFGL